MSTPTARAAGITDLQIVVDSHERYAYRFATQQVELVKQALACGDYGVRVEGRLVEATAHKVRFTRVCGTCGTVAGVFPKCQLGLGVDHWTEVDGVHRRTGMPRLPWSSPVRGRLGPSAAPPRHVAIPAGVRG